MEASATTGDIFNPILIPGDVSGFQASDVHKRYTTDLELTRDFCCGNWQMMGSIGARYAEVRRSVALSSNSLAGPDFLTASGLAEQSTDGLGVTFSWAAVRPVSCWGCCFDYFCKLRGSVLWGDSTSSALTSAMVVGPGGTAFSYNGAIADGTGSTWVGELQTGVMWSRCVSTWNARLFASIALEYQYWDVDGGGNANAHSYAGGSPGISLITIGSSSPNLSTHLVGFTIGTGFIGRPTAVTNQLRSRPAAAKHRAYGERHFRPRAGSEQHHSLGRSEAPGWSPTNGAVEQCGSASNRHLAETATQRTLHHV